MWLRKVKEWLSKDKVLLLIQAHDGSGRGKSKLSPPDTGKFIDCLSSLELGEAFGRQMQFIVQLHLVV